MIAGGWGEHGKLEDSKNYDGQMNYTLGSQGAKDGAGYKLETVLNDYVKALQVLTEDSVDGLALLARPGSEIPEYKDDPDQMNKDFAELNFDHTPNIACLAVLSQMETDVVRYETEVVDYFAQKVGATKLKFDEVIPMVKPDSKIVPAGTEYRADLFITARSKSLTPKMTSTTGAVRVDPDTKMGEIKFTAKGGTYDPKTFQSRKTYKASITIPSPRGGDTTLTIEEEYFVAKPVVQVQSASVQALYLNCGNELTVSIPAFGEKYDPRFSSSTGETIAGAKKGLVTVVPNVQKVLAANKKAKLTVSSTGYSETLEFSVRKIPDPRVDVFTGNSPANPKNGIPCSGTATARAIADSDFKSFLPKDARYKVTKVEVILKRGKKAISTQMLRNGTINLNAICQAFRPGDQLVVTIMEVQRLNFKGQKEVVRLPQKIAIYPLN